MSTRRQTFNEPSAIASQAPLSLVDTSTLYLATDGTIQQLSAEACELLKMEEMTDYVGSFPFSAGAWAGCDADIDFWCGRDVDSGTTKLVTALYRETGLVAKFFCTISEMHLRTMKMHSRVLVRDVTHEVQVERWITWQPSLLEMIARRCEISETLDTIAQAATETFEAEIATIRTSGCQPLNSRSVGTHRAVGSQNCAHVVKSDSQLKAVPVPQPLRENIYHLGDHNGRRECIGNLEIVGARLQPDGSADAIARALAHLVAIALNNYEQDIRLVLLKEAELKLLGIQLHNEPIQRLSALHNLVDRVEPSRLHREINKCVESLRTLSFAYYPALEKHGLGGAVKLLLERQARASGWRTQCEVLCNHVSIDAETVVFRTVQEAIQNAAKHAKASEVTVRLWQNEDKLMGVVEDDGMGIRGGTEPQDEEPGYHVGIAASRCSLEQLGGTLQVSPREGGGTRVSFEVPGQAEIGTRHRTSVR